MPFEASRRTLLKAGLGMVGVGTGAGTAYSTQDGAATNNEFQRAARDMAVKNRDKYARAKEQFSRGYWSESAEEQAIEGMKVFIPDYQGVTIDVLDLATKTNPGGTGNQLLDGIESSVRVISALHFANIEAYMDDAPTEIVTSAFDRLIENSELIEGQDNRGQKQPYKDRKEHLEEAYRALVILERRNRDWKSPVPDPQRIRQSAYSQIRQIMEIHRTVLYVDYQTTQSFLQNEPVTETLPEAAEERFPNRDINAVDNGEINTLDTPDEYALYRISPSEDETGGRRELVVRANDLANTEKLQIHLAAEPIDPERPMAATNAQLLSASETDSEELRLVQDGNLEDGNDRYVLVTSDIPTTYRLFTHSKGNIAGLISSDIDPEYIDGGTVPNNTIDISVDIIDTNDPVTAGEVLEVTAEIKNTGNQEATQDVQLIVGNDPEQVDTQSVTISGGETQSVTLDFETADVDNDQEFPVRIETGDSADEETVEVTAEDTNADINVQPGTEVLFEAGVNPENDWASEWHINEEEQVSKSRLGVGSVAFIEIVEEYEADYYSHEFQSTGTHEVTAYIFSNMEERGNYDQAETTTWTVNVTEDGMAPPTVTGTDPDPDTPLRVGREEPFELNIDVSSPDSQFERAYWEMTQADVVLEFQQLDGNQQTVNLSMDDGASCHTCSINATIITEDGLLVRSDYWKLNHESESEDLTLDVSIIDTNTPVNAGEYLEVTAELENTSNAEIVQDISLIVGNDPEQVDSETVTVFPNSSTEVSLGYQTPTVENTQEFPVRIETGNNSAEQTVQVNGTTDSSSGDNDSENQDSGGESSSSLAVSITGTNAPVDAGNQLTVTAQLQNTGSQAVSETVALIVGNNPEQVDSQTVSVSGGSTQTVTLGYSTYPAEQDTSFPVRIEGASDSDQRTVTVYGTG